MAQSDNRKKFPFSRPGNYKIHVLGSLDESWSEKPGGFRITMGCQKDRAKPVTELVGRVRDQAELAGILEALYELHLPILLVEYQDE